jgi:hypothetical protein
VCFPVNGESAYKGVDDYGIRPISFVILFLFCFLGRLAWQTV